MIFGVKTRKDLKKEIEELKKKIEEYCHSESIRKVTIVPTTRQLIKLKASCYIPAFLCSQYPKVADENIQRSLEESISKDLSKYMEVEVYNDPLGISLQKQIIGTLTVVVPEKGGIYDDSNSKIDIS